eukprot:1487564-Karenia_brevis.AAC.1
MDHITVGFGPLSQAMGKGQRTHGSHPNAPKGDGVANPVEWGNSLAQKPGGRCVETKPQLW